ncbi:MAG: hypothetical protein ACLT5P_13450 [Flavonifractor plautii]
MKRLPFHICGWPRSVRHGVLMSLVMMFLAVGYTMPAGAFFMAYR